MKKLSVILILLFAFTSVTHAVIGWSGNIWPNSYTDQTNGLDITVYYQIWKDGVTNLPGPGDSLSAKLYYRTQDQGTYLIRNMLFNVDVGNNDEYYGIIQNVNFNTGDTVFFYCQGYDSTDATYSYGTDQSGAGPFTDVDPGEYYIVAGLNQDVTVTFQVDMSLVDPVYTVSVAGTFNGWTPGADTLSDDDGDNIYKGDVLFPAGTNPHQEYKFVNGTNWEDQIGNRQIMIDDTSPTMILPSVYFNDITPNEVEVTFQVDMSLQILNGWFDPDVDSSFVSGSINDWNKWSLVDLDGDQIYSNEYTFYADIGDVIEYKFRINDDFELFGQPNRTFTIDQSPTTIPLVYYDNFNPNPPLNLVATVNGTDVDLDWDPPTTRDVDYYKIYRNGSIIVLIYDPTTHYTDMNLPWGAYEYYVSAVYPEGESRPSNIEWVIVGNNTPPVADAGPDQIVIEGDPVQLDGSGSYDPDGLAITYHWEAPAGIQLSDSTAMKPSFDAPQLDEDTDYTFTLIVFDGELYSDPDEVTITVLNIAPPTADFTAYPITGSAPLEVSFFDASYPVIEAWEWDFGDGNASVAQNPFHTYDSAGVYTVSLTVTNMFGVDTFTRDDYIVVAAAPLNPPTNLTYSVDDNDVTLDWDAPTSKDVDYYKIYRDYDVIAFVYHPTTTYEDSDLDYGQYQYFVTAMYPEGESSPTNMVTVDVVNEPPVADAGPDQQVDEGTFVQLDGSGSYDPEGLPLTYDWVTSPEITLDDPTIVNPSFTAPLVNVTEIFPIALTVYDGYQWSEPDTVFITVYELMDMGDEPQNLETALHASYPNPFNSSTTISFSLKDNSHVEIVIYNVKGERVSTLMNENCDPGTHTFRWDGTDLSAGIYFIKLKVNDKVTDIQKTIILR